MTNFPFYAQDVIRRSKDAIVIDTQAIDLEHHLKRCMTLQQEVKSEDARSQHIDLHSGLKTINVHEVISHDPANIPQVIEYKGDLKKDGSGGRRYATNCYDLQSALEIVLSFRNRTSGLDDTLTKAFGIAMNEIDTNAYRRERNRLFNGLSKDKADLQAAKETEKEPSLTNTLIILLANPGDRKDSLG